jgi:hypothetical protein
MADREKVIYDIERCICHVPDACRDCSHYQDDPELDCMEKLLADALALLKEQDAVEPTLIREGRNKNYNDYVCPRCDNVVVYEQNYCSECGVQFLWEGR